MINILEDLSVNHINAAINAIGYGAKYHNSDDYWDKVPNHIIVAETRFDIIEIYDKDGNNVGTLVRPTKILQLKNGEYRIKNVWDIKSLLLNQK